MAAFVKGPCLKFDSTSLYFNFIENRIIKLLFFQILSCIRDLAENLLLSSNLFAGVVYQPSQTKNCCIEN